MYCRLCLETKVTMFNMNANLCQVYQNLVSQSDDALDITKWFACYECYQHLQNILKFQQKCQRSLYILEQLAICNDKITLNDIKGIDRDICKISSPLSVSKTLCLSADSMDTMDPTEYEDEEYLDLENLDEGPLDTTHDDKQFVFEGEIKCEFDNDTVQIEEDNSIIPSTEKQEQDIKPMNSPENGFLLDMRRNRNVSHEILKTFEGYATVIHMTMKQARNEILMRRESKNYKESVFKCDLCYRGFGLETTFERHMNRHSKDNGNYECKICYMWFESQQRLRRHTHICHRRKFLCKLCPYKCVSTCQASVHMRSHKGQKYTCDECDAQFSNGCVICGETFTDKTSLKLHKRTHLQKYDYTEINTRQSKSQRKPLRPCPVCNILLSQRYESHIIKNHPEHEITKQITDQSSYCICEVCGKIQTRIKLAKHLETHSSDCLHKCDECGKCFKSELRRDEHRKTMHLIKQLYECDKCPRQFRFKSSLWKHTRAQHDGIRPNKCNTCDKTYTFPSDLKQHIKHVHEKVLWPKKNPERESRRPPLNRKLAT